MTRKLLQLIATLCLLVSAAATQNFTVSVTNSTTAITVPAGLAGFSAVVKENSATPSAQFDVNDALTPAVAVHNGVGSTYVFTRNPGFPFTGGTVLGQIVLTNGAGPVTFTVQISQLKNVTFLSSPLTLPSLNSTITFGTGLGAITHLQGPSDQAFLFATQNNQNLNLSPNGTGSVVISTNLNTKCIASDWCYVHLFPGATEDVQADNCRAWLPTTGGTCDGGGLTTPQSWAGTVTLDRPFHYIFGPTSHTSAPGLTNPGISCTSNACNGSDISGVPGAVIKGPGDSTVFQFIKFLGSISGNVNIGADVNVGDTTITLTSGGGATFTAGDHAYCEDQIPDRHAFVFWVISKATDVLTISPSASDNLRFTGPGGANNPDGSFCHKITPSFGSGGPIRDVKIHDLTFDNNGSTGANSYFIRYDFANFGEFYRIKCTGINTAGVIAGIKGACLERQTGYGNSAHDFTVLGAGSTATPSMYSIKQTLLDDYAIKIDTAGQVADAFSYQIHQVHHSHIRGVNVNGTGSSARGIKLYRSNLNNIEDSSVEGIGTAGATTTARPCWKIENTSSFNTFTNVKAIGCGANGFDFSGEGNIHDTLDVATAMFNVGNGIQTRDSSTQIYQETGLSLTFSGCAAGVCNLTRSTGVWCSAPSGGSCPNSNNYVIGQFVQITGCTNAGNNDKFQISSITSTTVVVIANPGNTTTNETCPAASETILAGQPDDFLEVNGGRFCCDRTSASPIVSLGGSGFILNGAEIYDDKNIATAGFAIPSVSTGTPPHNSDTVENNNIHNINGSNSGINLNNATTTNLLVHGNQLPQGATLTGTHTTPKWYGNPGFPDINSLGNTSILSSAYTNATTTFSNVTGLSFPLQPSTNYLATCRITWQGSATTTGPKYQFTGPASPTSVALGMNSIVTATTVIAASATAFSSPVANTGTITAITNFTDTLTIGVVNGANAGTAQLQAAANGAGTLTIQPGSYCTVQ